MVSELDLTTKEPDRTSARSLENWIEMYKLPDDELWWYDTGGESWETLCGENGFALIRGGKVFEFYMWLMN